MQLRNRTVLWATGLIALALVVAVTASSIIGTGTVEVTIPAGTAIRVRLDHSLASDKNSPGDEFSATVDSPVVVDGRTIFEPGAKARGTVVEAVESGRLQTPAVLTIALSEVELDGSWVDLDTNARGARKGSHARRNAFLIGGGAGAGAIIGAIAGGGKGAAIGAAAGAGAGTAAAAATGKKEIRLVAETPLTFQLSKPVTVKVPAGSKT